MLLGLVFRVVEEDFGGGGDLGHWVLPVPPPLRQGMSQAPEGDAGMVVRRISDRISVILDVGAFP